MDKAQKIKEDDNLIEFFDKLTLNENLKIIRENEIKIH